MRAPAAPVWWTAAVLLLLATLARPRVIREMPDFEVYYRAGARALAAEPLYRESDGHFQHKYLPVFALLVAPAALVPLPAAKTIWFYLSVGIIAGLVASSLWLLPHRRRRRWVLAALTTAAMAKFYLHELNLGQCNALMALLVLAGLWGLLDRRPLRAGVALAASAAVKPYPVVLLPYLLWTRRAAASAWFLAGVGAGLVLPATVYGLGGNLRELGAWVATLAQSTAPNLLNQDNVSIWAMWAKWLGVGPLAGGLAVATIAAVVALVGVMARQGEGLDGAAYLDVATIMLLVPLLSPQGWDYGLLGATPAVMLLVNVFDRLPRPARIAAGTALVVMSLSIFDLMGRRAYAAFMSVSTVTVCALVLVGALALVRRERLA
jgi:Glycosyltransferase family 87